MSRIVGWVSWDHERGATKDQGEEKKRKKKGQKQRQKQRERREEEEWNEWWQEEQEEEEQEDEKEEEQDRKRQKCDEDEEWEGHEEEQEKERVCKLTHVLLFFSDIVELLCFLYGVPLALVSDFAHRAVEVQQSEVLLRSRSRGPAGCPGAVPVFTEFS